MIVEAIGIHLTPHISKTYSGAGKTGTEVGWYEHGLLGVGETDGTKGGYRAEYKNMG